ncbi:MAG: hypothetical protein HY796_06310 [Elusimicrobia bacterium]|nr:hypothetical protein [Elusimicrobiota bacterium]
MSADASRILERLAVESLERCVVKLSKVSVGVWHIDKTNISWGTMEEAIRQHSFNNDAASAVYFDIKGGFPFVAMIIFEPRDIECIAKCFLGYAFPRTQSLRQSEELLLSELGNIILNSFIGSMCNVLKISFVPSAPKCVHGEPQYLLEAFGATMDLKQNFRIITVTLSIQCDKAVTKSEVIGIIPGKLEAEIERIFKFSF